MDDSLAELFDGAINLELKVGGLYALFQQHLLPDQDFWGQLALEEKKHAALLMSCRDVSMALWQFPAGLLPKFPRILYDGNSRIQTLIDKFSLTPPDRVLAFTTALELENSAGELHYQLAMTRPADSSLMKIFQELNNGDRDHYRRIKKYMEENAISTASYQEAAGNTVAGA